MVEEIWKPVLGYEGLYEVSNQGRVKSLDRVVPHKRIGSQTIAGRMMRAHAQLRGRQRVSALSLCRGGKVSLHRVHVLVAEAFIGPRPEGLLVCHNNGDSQDNRAENLRYDTDKGNAADRLLHGTHGRGAKNHKTILSEDDVREIRRLREEEQVKPSRLARKFGVDSATISDIFAKRSWAWLI